MGKEDYAVRAGPPRSDRQRLPKTSWWFRLLLVITGLAAWFWTQSLIGARQFPDNQIGDGLFDWTASIHAYLVAHPRVADGLLIVSSLLIDGLGVFLLAWSIFGPSLRPFLGLLLLLGLRQICQGLCALPAPEGMIWRDPGFPSLLVTYSVANDFFFSGHTGVAVYGAFELASLPWRWLKVVAVGIAFFEAATVMVLRAHYTMDVYAGAVTGLLVAVVVTALAPPLDQTLSRGFARLRNP